MATKRRATGRTSSNRGGRTARSSNVISGGARKLDPRHGPRNVRGRSARRQQHDFAWYFREYPAPVIAGGAFIFLIAVFLISRPALNKRSETASFNGCLSKVMELRGALERYKREKGTYGVQDLFIPLDLGSNLELESWMGTKCNGPDKKLWTMNDNLHIAPGAQTYTLTAFVRNKTSCRIDAGPDTIFPVSADKCAPTPLNPVK